MLANNAFSSTVMDQAGDVLSVTRSNACDPLITAFKHFGYINLIKQLYSETYILFAYLKSSRKFRPNNTNREDKKNRSKHIIIIFAGVSEKLRTFWCISNPNTNVVYAEQTVKDSGSLTSSDSNVHILDHRGQIWENSPKMHLCWTGKTIFKKDPVVSGITYRPRSVKQGNNPLVKTP